MSFILIGFPSHSLAQGEVETYSISIALCNALCLSLTEQQLVSSKLISSLILESFRPVRSVGDRL